MVSDILVDHESAFHCEHADGYTGSAERSPGHASTGRRDPSVPRFASIHAHIANRRTQEYLTAFLKILMKLERVSPANSHADDSSDLEDEEAELRSWADLREYQLKFTQQGGFLGLS